MAFLDIFKASAIKAENVNLLAGLDKAVREKAHLEALLHEIGGTDLIKVKEMIKQHESVCAEVIQRREALQKEADEIEQQVKVRRRELLVDSYAIPRRQYRVGYTIKYQGIPEPEPIARGFHTVIRTAINAPLLQYIARNCGTHVQNEAAVLHAEIPRHDLRSRLSGVRHQFQRHDA